MILVPLHHVCRQPLLEISEYATRLTANYVFVEGELQVTPPEAPDTNPDDSMEYFCAGCGEPLNTIEETWFKQQMEQLYI